MTPAVVLGACGHGLAVIHALSSKGVPVVVLESDSELPGAKTNAARVFFVESMNNESLIESLVNLRQRICCPGKPVLFLANDKMVRLLGLNWDRLEELFSLSWSGCRDHLLPLLEKSSLEPRCREVGLYYPETRIVESESDVDTVLDALGFPLILKPARPLSGFKTIIPKTRQEIIETLTKYCNDLPFIAQRLIPGDDRSIFFTAFYLSKGEIIARFDGHKLRSRPLGHTTIGESFISDSVFEQTRRFFEGLDLSGPVSLEVKQDETGCFWVIEPTLGRTDFWVGLCIKNGVNLPFVEYCHQVGREIPESRQEDRSIWFNEERDPLGILWLSLQRDFRFRGRIPTFLYFHLDDLGPCLLALRRICHSLFQSLLRRASRLVFCGSPTEVKSHEIILVDSLEGDLSVVFDKAECDSIYSGRAWYENLVSTVFTNDPGVRFAVYKKNGMPEVVFPFHFSNIAFGTRVESLGNYYTPLYTPALDESIADDVFVDAVKGIYSALGSPVAIRFSPMNPEVPAYNSMCRALSSVGIVPFKFFCFGNWYLKVNQDWDSYIKNRPGVLRTTLRRSMSRLIRDGGRLEMFTENSDIDRVIDAYLTVYSRSGKRPEPFPDFIPGLVRLAAQKKWLRMGIAWMGERPIAAQIWLVANGKADIYKLAYDSNDKMYSPGTLLTSMLMQHAFEVDRVSEVDYLVGDDPYKKLWMSHRRERWGIVAYNPRTLMGALGLIREVLGRFVKSVFSGVSRKRSVQHADGTSA